MSDRDDVVFLGHMLDLAHKAVAKVEGVSREDSDADEDLRMVSAHLIQVIGEAASRVSEETKLGQPKIPWKEIVGMRHRIVHDSMNVDYDMVWDVLRNKLPPQIRSLSPLVPSDDG